MSEHSQPMPANHEASAPDPELMMPEHLVGETVEGDLIDRARTELAASQAARLAAERAAQEAAARKARKAAEEARKRQQKVQKEKLDIFVDTSNEQSVTDHARLQRHLRNMDRPGFEDRIYKKEMPQAPHNDDPFAVLSRRGLAKERKDETTLRDTYQPESGVNVLRDAIAAAKPDRDNLLKLYEQAKQNKDVSSLTTISAAIKEYDDAKRKAKFHRLHQLAKENIRGYFMATGMRPAGTAKPPKAPSVPESAPAGEQQDEVAEFFGGLSEAAQNDAWKVVGFIDRDLTAGEHFRTKRKYFELLGEHPQLEFEDYVHLLNLDVQKGILATNPDNVHDDAVTPKMYWKPGSPEDGTAGTAGTANGEPDDGSESVGEAGTATDGEAGQSGADGTTEQQDQQARAYIKKFHDTLEYIIRGDPAHGPFSTMSPKSIAMRLGVSEEEAKRLHLSLREAGILNPDPRGGNQILMEVEGIKRLADTVGYAIGVIQRNEAGEPAANQAGDGEDGAGTPPASVPAPAPATGGRPARSQRRAAITGNFRKGEMRSKADIDALLGVNERTDEEKGTLMAEYISQQPKIVQPQEISASKRKEMRNNLKRLKQARTLRTADEVRYLATGSTEPAGGTKGRPAVTPRRAEGKRTERVKQTAKRIGSKAVAAGKRASGTMRQAVEARRSRRGTRSFNELSPEEQRARVKERRRELADRQAQEAALAAEAHNRETSRLEDLLR